MYLNENKYDNFFQTYANKYNHDWLLLKAQVKQESAFIPNAVSSVGAQGLSQVMPKTWLEWEDESPGIQNQFKDFDPFNPEDSIRVQAAYMRWLEDRVTSLVNDNVIEWTLAAYNWGIGNVIKQIQSKHHFDLAVLPTETKIYVKKILIYYDEYLKKKTELINDINMEPMGPEIIPSSKKNQELKMERITSVGKINAKETTDLLYGVGKILSSIKKSLGDDGKITGGDAFNFADDIIPLVNGVVGADKIPAEFADGYDEIEKSEMGIKLHEALEGVDPKDMNAVDAILNVVYSVQNALIVTGIIK